MSGVLERKVAFVTGGRGGIGRAICDRFSKEGAHVFAGDLNVGGGLWKDTTVAILSAWMLRPNWKCRRRWPLLHSDSGNLMFW